MEKQEDQHPANPCEAPANPAAKIVIEAGADTGKPVDQATAGTRKQTKRAVGSYEGEASAAE